MYHDNTTEHFLKLGLQSSLKNTGIYRKIVDKIQNIDTYNLNSDNYEWKFKCYNRNRFKKIRIFFKIDLNSYIQSLCNENMISGKTYPKSGAKFWKTADNKYIVKTITKKECKFFRGILKRYSNHVKDDTYLVKIFGMYRITLSNFDSRFIIMNNIFRYEMNIDNIFDLKGTTEERYANEKSVELKDMNFIKRNNSFILSNQDHTQFIATIMNDTNFLNNMNIMDYSLVVAIIEYDSIHNVPKIFFDTNNIKMCFIKKKIRVYIFGIVDILQEWTLWKRCCGFWKKFYYRFLLCDKLIEIDSEKPSIYRERFIEFIKKNTKLSTMEQELNLHPMLIPPSIIR
jgi:hypothetical protein